MISLLKKAPPGVPAVSMAGLARELGVPQQVALAGFSNEGFTTIAEPLLTSVGQRCAEMGAAAVRLFLELATVPGDAGAPRQVLLQPQLLIWNSSLC